MENTHLRYSIQYTHDEIVGCRRLQICYVIAHSILVVDRYPSRKYSSKYSIGSKDIRICSKENWCHCFLIMLKILRMWLRLMDCLVQLVLGLVKSGASYLKTWKPSQHYPYMPRIQFLCRFLLLISKFFGWHMFPNVSNLLVYHSSLNTFEKCRK